MTIKEFDHRIENLSQRLHFLVEEKPLNIIEVLQGISNDLTSIGVDFVGDGSMFDEDNKT